MNMNYLKTYEELDPFYNHYLRLKKGYKPKYRSGLIGIRFQDDELTKIAYRNNFPLEELPQNYQNIFSKNKNQMGEVERRFVEFFEKKYNIKLSDYRSGSDDFFIYFKCESGEEENILKRLSDDKIIKDVDFVDVRSLEISEELQDISEELEELSMEFSEISDEEYRKKINSYINRLKKCL